MRMIVIFEEINGKVWAIVLDDRGDEIARYLEEEPALSEFV